MYFDPNVGLYRCISDNHNSKVIQDSSVVARDPPQGFNEFGPFYKCCLINKTTKQFMKCGFSTNLRNEFTRHVRLAHRRCQFLCVYCSDTVHFDKLTVFEEPIFLIRHVEVRHPNRYFQCNLCEYRAITADHVNLHQAANHTAELENCLIFFCDSPKLEKDLTLKQFYDRFRSHRNPNSSELYQCLYCSYPRSLFQDVILHQVDEHPDMPLLYYSPIKAEKEVIDILTDDENDDDVIEISVPKNGTNNNSVEEISISSESNSTEDGISMKELKPAIEEILLTSDEDDDENDDEEGMDFVCFFCSVKNKSYNASKKHILSHLFDLEGLKKHDIFFDKWVNLFLSSQHSLFDVSEEGQNYEKMCPICAKFNSVTELETAEDPNRQRVHYILHSCFKPIQCLLCPDGQFWLPKLMRKIVHHLVNYHKSDLTENQQLDALMLTNQEQFTKFKPEDWIELKKKLITLKAINEFSTSNREQYHSISAVDQRALKMLVTTYQSYLNKISPFNSSSNQDKLKSNLQECNPIVPQDVKPTINIELVELVTDDED